MATGDRQIGTLHVYANPDPSIERDPVKIKCYKSVTVCVLVLCVLLLTEVIVLCVTFTQERDRLTLKIDNLTKVTDNLLTKSQSLANERDRLTLKIDNLTKVTDYLLTKSQNLTNERDRLMWEKSKLQKNLNTADGWIYYQSSLYFISSENKSWTESRRYCREREADLIIINNKEEQDFVRNISNAETIWIGLTDSAVEGIWKWVDDSTLIYTNWVSGEPNNGAKDEDYAESSSTGWNDQPSNFNRKWICEINMFIKLFSML